MIEDSAAMGPLAGIVMSAVYSAWITQLDFVLMVLTANLFSNIYNLFLLTRFISSLWNYIFRLMWILSQFLFLILSISLFFSPRFELPPLPDDLKGDKRKMPLVCHFCGEVSPLCSQKTGTEFNHILIASSLFVLIKHYF